MQQYPTYAETLDLLKLNKQSIAILCGLIRSLEHKISRDHRLHSSYGSGLNQLVTQGRGLLSDMDAVSELVSARA